MIKVQYFELPTNIRVAFIFVCLGIASLALYSVGVRVGATVGENQHPIQINNVVLGVGMYLVALIQLKIRSFSTYIGALIILGPLSFYYLFGIFQLYSEHMAQANLYIWWPTVHFSIFSVCFFLSITPKTIEFYRS